MYIENNILATLQVSDDGTLNLGFTGFWTQSIILYSQRNTTFRKFDLFSSLGVEMGVSRSAEPSDRK